MGKEQELLDAARTGNLAVVDKIAGQRMRRSGPLGPMMSLRRSVHPSCQDSNGDTPLHHAALNGHLAIVESLLRYEASTAIADNNGCYALHLAAWNGFSDICKALLSQGPSIAKINQQNNDSETALHCAAQYGHTDTVAVLLEHRADSSVRNCRHECALDLAAQYGRLDTVKLLVRQPTALPYSCAGATTGPVNTNCAPNLSSPHSVHTHSPLHLAARNGHLSVVKLLIDAGLDINTKTDNGSALHECSLFGKPDVVRLLLQAGIDPYIEDSHSRTALNVVKEHKSAISVDIARLITEHLELTGRWPPSAPLPDNHPHHQPQHQPQLATIRGHHHYPQPTRSSHSPNRPPQEPILRAHRTSQEPLTSNRVSRSSSSRTSSCSSSRASSRTSSRRSSREDICDTSSIDEGGPLYEDISQFSLSSLTSSTTDHQGGPTSRSHSEEGHNPRHTVVTVTSNGTLTRRPVKPKRTPSSCSTRTFVDRVDRDKDTDSAASSSDYGSSTGPLHLSGPTPPCVPPRPWAHGIDSFYSRSLDTNALQTDNCSIGDCSPLSHSDKTRRSLPKSFHHPSVSPIMSPTYTPPSSSLPNESRMFDSHNNNMQDNGYNDGTIPRKPPRKKTPSCRSVRSISSRQSTLTDDLNPYENVLDHNGDLNGVNIGSSTSESMSESMSGSSSDDLLDNRDNNNTIRRKLKQERNALKNADLHSSDIVVNNSYEDIVKDKWIHNENLKTVIHGKSVEELVKKDEVPSPTVESDKALLEKWDLLGGSLGGTTEPHDEGLYAEIDGGDEKRDMEKDEIAVLASNTTSMDHVEDTTDFIVISPVTNVRNSSVTLSDSDEDVCAVFDAVYKRCAASVDSACYGDENSEADSYKTAVSRLSQMSITSTMSMSSTHIKSTGSSRPPSLEFGSKRNSRCSNRYSSASVGGVSGGIPENEPLSPSGYEQPPTPDHPPPSPMTAILGIQEKINPNEKRKSRDMETITERQFMGVTYSPLVHRHLVSGGAERGSDSENSQRSCDSPLSFINDSSFHSDLSSSPANVDSANIQIVNNSQQVFIGLTKGSCTPENPTPPQRLDKVLANHPRPPHSPRPGFHPPLPPKPAVPPRTSSVRSRPVSDEIENTPSGKNAAVTTQTMNDTRTSLLTQDDLICQSAAPGFEDDNSSVHTTCPQTPSSTSSTSTMTESIHGTSSHQQSHGLARNISSHGFQSMDSFTNTNMLRTSKCDVKADCLDRNGVTSGDATGLTLDSNSTITDSTDVHNNSGCVVNGDQVAPPRKKNVCKKLSVEERISSMDENEEWAKIADIMASFGGDGLLSECEASFTEILSGVSKLESVSEWLESLDLSQYENTLVSNGYDDMLFMCPNVLEESDLEEIFIIDPEHRHIILSSLSQRPNMPSIDASGVDNVCSWLQSLHLQVYWEAFQRNEFTSMERVKQIWDLELNNVLDISLPGHRKRILASLKVPSYLEDDCWSRTDVIDIIQEKGMRLSVSVDTDLNDLRLAQCSTEDLSMNSHGDKESEGYDIGEQGQGHCDSDVEGEISVMQNSCDIKIQKGLNLIDLTTDEEVLLATPCNYNAQYLGSTLVKHLQGAESTKESINKMKLRYWRKIQKTSNTPLKLPSVTLAISYTGVKFIDAKTQHIICEHEIGNIFCACQDGDDLNYFAYITKDMTSLQHYCHVFMVNTTDEATAVILALGKSFEIAYQMALQTRKSTSGQLSDDVTDDQAEDNVV